MGNDSQREYQNIRKYYYYLISQLYYYINNILKLYYIKRIRYLRTSTVCLVALTAQ